VSSVRRRAREPVAEGLTYISQDTPIHVIKFYHLAQKVGQGVRKEVSNPKCPVRLGLGGKRRSIRRSQGGIR